VSLYFAPPSGRAGRLAAAGVERAVFGLPSEPRDTALVRLDAYAAVMRS
jgi:hypothetical protein